MNRWKMIGLVFGLTGLAFLSGLTARAADAPAADPDNGSWQVRVDDFFAAGKPLNVYANRRDGKWVAAVGTSRIPGTGRSHYSYNLGKYVCDVSAVKVNGDKFTGSIKVTLTPDPWVPPDHKARSVVVEVDGKLGDPDASVKGQLRSVQGSYKAKLDAGIRDQTTNLNGTLSGGIVPTQASELNDLSYELVFHQTDDDNNLWVKFGIQKGAIVTANVGYVNFEHARQ